MVYVKATYEEYCKASAYAKIRYKFGVYIQLVAVVLLLILLCYTVLNIEEMKANPAEYAEKKMDVECKPANFRLIYDDTYGSYGNITGINER